MGILNVTPDSFSDGGKYNEVELDSSNNQKMAFTLLFIIIMVKPFF